VYIITQIIQSIWFTKQLNKYTYFCLMQTDGCQNSGLFKAFSQHVLYRLKIYSRSINNRKITITFLSRNTKYRNILNENELIIALKKHPEYEVKKVIYFCFNSLYNIVCRLRGRHTRICCFHKKWLCCVIRWIDRQIRCDVLLVEINQYFTFFSGNL